ncbi:hypothetical protein J1N35_028223, partial [Gossypium stocksii]
MAESVAGAAAGAAVKTVADQAKECASPYFGYFFSYEKIVEDFTNQREALELRKRRVDTDVDGAKRQNEIIYDDVDDWLTRAEKELKETQNLKDEIDRVKCFKWCPKWGWRYSLSKKLAKKTPTISKLLETPYFAPVGYHRPLQGIEFITSTDFMDSESSKSAFNQIMEAIHAKGVKMIGLHGMPGVGKTTLAKEVGKHAREQKFFDKVVMFTMTQNPNIKNIQDKVAGMFGLKFKTGSQEGRAEELLESMKGVNKILVIVDDLWEEFNLESIGIPFGIENEGCKILLTTRQNQVCSKMKCQKEIQLGILSKDEAWVLFRYQAGLEDDCSILNEVAKEVAGECKGLPLAIVTVAKALNGESREEWEAANRRFKDSRHLDNEKVLGGVLKHLKLSYDYLKKGNSQRKENDIQMCLLLCSLFPEDDEIPLELLIMCGIGVGLFPDASSIEVKRTEIEAALKKLQKSGLLLETGDAERIRMHDVVRDFAHWLTSARKNRLMLKENRFMVKDKLKEWPDMVESFECYTAIALWNCSSNIKNFPDKVEFSKLKTLFLQGEWEGDDLLVVSSTFFEEMKALQVLYLENVSFSLKGFLSLPNLKTLWCKDCKLENFSSSLTNMRSLEILALENIEFDEISEALVKLSTLKYLYLSPKEMKIPPKLVSRLTSLQELHIRVAININLLELKPLSRLTALSCYTCEIPQEDFVFPKLQRYSISVNGLCCYFERARALDIRDFSSSFSVFNNLFCNAKEMRLINVGGQKNIVPSIDEMGVNELTFLLLGSCNDMEFLIDTTDQGSTVAFSNLVELKIMTMVSLKGLCNGASPIRFLQNLKQVSITSCPELQVIFQIDSFSKQRYWTPLLSNLTILELDSLPKLKRIWEVEPSHCAIASLQSLKVVKIKSCNNLKTIFSPYFAQSMLCMEELAINSCDGLEQVIGFAQEEEKITKNCCWPKLKILQINDCGSLKYVCPNTYAEGLQSLECVDITDCPQLIQAFNIGKFKDGLQSIWNSETSRPAIASSEIQKVRIINCYKLKTIFSTCLALNMLHLQQLVIGNCDELEQVIAFTQEEEISENDYPLPCWPKLKILEITSCKSLKYVYPKRLQLLEHLYLSHCPELVQVFNMEKVEPSHRSLRNLKVVYISDCNKLKTMFSTRVAQSMLNIEQLDIHQCHSLEQLIGFTQKEEIAENDCTLYCWPNLKVLRIRNCENLKYVSTNTLIQSLEFVYIENCPQLIQIFNMDENKYGQNIVLTGLGLQNYDDLEHVIGFTQEEEITENDYSLSCWPKLKFLEIISCGSLKYVYPKGLQFLEHLHLSHCPELVQVFNMEKVEPSHRSIASLQNLKVVNISNCNKLKTMFSPCLAQNMLCIEELYIEFCHGLEQVIGFAQEEEITQNDCPLYCWPKLRILRIQYCESLKYICTNTLILGHQSLEYALNDCLQFIQIFNMEQNKCGQNIVLPGLGLQNYDDIEHVIGFTQEEEITENNYPLSCRLKLKFLDINSCKSLKYVYPEGLQFLERLQLRHCPELVQVFNMEKVEPSHRSIASLQNLKVVNIFSCNKLKTMFSLCLVQSMLCIEELYIEFCHGLEQVIGFAREEEIAENDYSLYCWPKLRILHIQNCKSLKYVCTTTLILGHQSLKYVLNYCPQLIQIFNMEQNKYGQNIVLPEHGSQESQANLTSLELESVEKFIPNGPKFYVDHYNLNTISITKCDKFTYLFSEFTARALVHLEFLNIWHCPSLEHLIEEAENVDEIYVSNMKNHYPLFLPRLKRVYIICCENLKYLCSSTLAQGLPYLVDIWIEECPRLNQVFNMEKNKDRFGLQEFQSTFLTLRSLPELKCIWNESNHGVTFYRLNSIEIDHCDELTYLFSEFIARALVHLESLIIWNCSSLEHLIKETENVDEIYRKNHYPEPLANLTSSKIESLSELRCTWNRPNHFDNFHSLSVIKIKNCAELTYLFSELTARTSELLEIKNRSCSEHLIEEAENMDEINVSNLFLPKLKTVAIRNCENLKYLCSSTLAKGHPYLESIDIEHCPRLIQVFNMGKNKKEFGLQNYCGPKLKALQIVDCPIFSCVVVQAPLLE